METWQNYIPEDISDLYEVHDYKHAAAILKNEFPNEYNEIICVLRKFRVFEIDVISPGGSESAIPKRFSKILRPMNWYEKNLHAKLIVDDQEIPLDSHKVDYLKGRIAFDLEWNSKDQTYDRDLYAFRAFFEYNKISLGILVTRSNDLDPWFKQLNIMKKFGASTTQMGKLIPRLEEGRNGGCPILVFGITRKLISEGKLW
ncbi:MAG: hypothetical protein JEZ00_07810 [Anaerolineaceae bacterium]|nr:hypothetical protein [Anaerolineaceae bacterium]